MPSLLLCSLFFYNKTCISNWWEKKKNTKNMKMQNLFYPWLLFICHSASSHASLSSFCMFTPMTRPCPLFLIAAVGNVEGCVTCPGSSYNTVLIDDTPCLDSSYWMPPLCNIPDLQPTPVCYASAVKSPKCTAHFAFSFFISIVVQDVTLHFVWFLWLKLFCYFNGREKSPHLCLKDNYSMWLLRYHMILIPDTDQSLEVL